MSLNQKMITCKRCGSNACSETYNEQLSVWLCFGCGFTSNSTLTKEHIAEVEVPLPELYKALKFEDKYGIFWYPTAVTLENKAMVFAEGVSIEDWKWSAVQSVNNKPDMSTKKEFIESNFMDALEYIGYFK